MPQRKTRRARGTGTLFYSDSRQLWVGRLPCGRSPRGYTRYREVTHPTQAGVVARLAALAPPSDRTTVQDWAQRWLESLSVRPQTRESYQNSVVLRIVPSLGHLRVADVTAHQVESAIRDWSRLGLAVGTVRQSCKHLRILFGAAVRAELLSRNPVSLARKPRAESREVHTFTAAELSRIVAAGPPCVALVAATGMRKGEALALDVADFDPARGTVAITRTLVRPGRDGSPARLGPPKSPHSVRTIRVPDAALAAVRGAVRGRKAGPLFPGRDGHRLTEGEFNWAWRRTLRALELAYRSPHTLRHSVGSAMVANGAKLPKVAEYLGDTLATVVAVYIHPDSDEDAADALDRGITAPGPRAARGRKRA